MPLSVCVAVAAEDVRHLELHLHCRPSSNGGQGQIETIERARNRADRGGGDVQVAGSARQPAVTEQQLDGADVRAGLEEGSESVAQRVHGDVLADARGLAGDLAGQLYLADADVLARIPP
jgi:hypothetical protein